MLTREHRGEGGWDIDAYLDELSLWLTGPVLEMTTSEVNFGNLYVNSNGSTRDYNNLQKRDFQFMNSEQYGAKLNWSIVSSPEVTLNPTSGRLNAGATQPVDVWFQPSAIGATTTTVESDYTLLGDAWLREEDGAIRLTQNYGGLNGQAEYSNLPLDNKWSVSGQFWTGHGGTNGGDAFYVYVWADRTPLWQEDNAGHYSINFYEYYDRIELRYDGVLLASVSTPYLDALRWYSFRVTFHEGTFNIWCDGSLRLTYTDNNYQSRMSGNLFGFGGRTGTATNEHWVRYMKWSKHTHAIHLETTCGNIYIPIVANAYHASQPNYVGPEKGPNGKVNVALNDDVHFQVEYSPSSYPYAELGGYLWKKVSNELSASELDALTLDDFEETSGPDKYYYSLPDPGEFTVYIETYETINNNKIESDALDIPVRVWIRPTVNDTPPQTAIDDNLVSWYDSKYVGVVGEPVYLMADGGKGSTNPDEVIEEYLWDFDSNWDTIELTQPAGEAVSYAWDSPNLNGQIRCKAKTNYGVKSDEKLFNLTIYDALEPDAVGPYTGRPNTPVTLQGSVEKGKYPGAAFESQWRVNSITPVGTLKGDATSTADYVELTPNEGGKMGQFEYADLPLSDDWNVTGEFWSGGSSGADAFYIYVWANGTPITEDEANRQYSINFNEYQDQIQLNYDGALLAETPQPDLDNSQWRRFVVVFNQGIFLVYLDGRLRLEYDDSVNYETRMSNNLFGFGARTGGITNYHRVRNMKWTTGTPVSMDINGKAEYEWGPTGNESDTYGVEFTTTVTTEEEFVLIRSNSTSVTVEAGKPTAIPGGPYRCGIYGGSFSPNQFEGNHPDYVEADDVGHIVDWMWFFSDGGNQALEFDGVGDYVEAAAIDERSVEMWIKPGKEAQMGLYSGGTAGADGQNYSIAIYERNGLGGDSEFDINSAGLFLSFHGYDIAVPYDGILSKWHYIAISWDGGTGVLIGIDGQFLKGYVWDGTLETWTEQSEQPFTLPGTPQPDPTAPTRIAWDAGSGYFDGIIDEVAIWNVPLTKDEILAHLDNSGELVGNEQGLVLYWKLEETEGMTAHDQSPNGNDGTLNPMTPVWNAEGHPVVSHGIWNPTHAFTTAGKYTAGLIVQSEFGKWSYQKTAKVEAIDGKIAGYVRAADLRTPVKEVTLTLTSSHVYKNVLAQIATSDDSLNTTGEGGLQTLTDDNGYYEFTHIPLGIYRIVANKGEGDKAHEFEKNIQATELVLDGPNQLAIDFVDISVYPVGGRIVYSIQKNGQDVLVAGVKVKAYPIGSTSSVEALLSKKSLSATGTNYSMPLFAGKYLFVPDLSQRDIRIKEDTPGYDSDIQLVTIEDARTDIDFVDYTKRKLTVFLVDSGGYGITAYPDTEDPIKVTVSGNNGQVSDQEVDAEGKIVVDMNPGEYTVTVTGASPETEDVDLTGGDQAITMTIPVQIELFFSPRPKLLDIPPEHLEQLGLRAEDNPEGYMYYYPPEPRAHTYTITATANGKIVEDFTLFVTDDVSMMTVDAAVEQEIFVSGDEGEYTIAGGLPKMTDDSPPLAAPKTVRFQATKEGYLDSDTVEDEVTVLGDVAVGAASQIISIPVVNYTVLHDPAGDGSYSYLDDSVTIKGLVTGLQIKIEDEEIPVYPSPWRVERKVEDFEFEESPDSSTEFRDMEDKGLLGYRNSDPTLGHFTWAALLEVGTGGYIVSLGPAGYALQLAKMGIKAAAVTPVGTSQGIVQYEVSPNRHLSTPSGDGLSHLQGPGKGDIYYGEGWTLGLQTKYRLGIECTNREGDDGPCNEWALATNEILTYDILDRTNQYVYTTRDIENLISDLDKAINAATNEEEISKLTNARNTWNDLLNKNLAYVWNRDYVPYLHHPDEVVRKSFEDFKNAEGSSLDDDEFETLIFSAGPTFKYSRMISTSHTVNFSTKIYVSSDAKFGNQLKTGQRQL